MLFSWLFPHCFLVIKVVCGSFSIALLTP
ncbi:TPA: DUF3265 domain-containing protein [Vibrio vulnificus]|nr:DUF3265 domain-containing protein [Vibrio vulnificus]